jgi:ABC-type multidrug transport system fused ATPase/permease subunit
VPPLLRDLLRPYRRTLAIILAVTLVSMVMSLAAPWPLKVILDNVVASHPPPSWIAWLFPMVGGTTKAHIAAAAGIATVAIAVVSGAAFYVASYSRRSWGKASGTICACAFITTCSNCRSRSTTTAGSAPSSAPSPQTFKRFRASCQPPPSTSPPTP